MYILYESISIRSVINLVAGILPGINLGALPSAIIATENPIALCGRPFQQFFLIHPTWRCAARLLQACRFVNKLLYQRPAKQLHL